MNQVLSSTPRQWAEGSWALRGLECGLTFAAKAPSGPEHGSGARAPVREQAHGGALPACEQDVLAEGSHLVAFITYDEAFQRWSPGP